VQTKDTFQIGSNGHNQIIKWGVNKEGEAKLISLSCSCEHGTIYQENWEMGEGICWHLKSAMNILKRRIKHGKTNRQANIKNA